MPQSASGAAGQPHTVWATGRGVDHRPARAHRLAAETRAGQVYVNTYGAGGGVELPCGGCKKSGVWPREGNRALDMFTATQTVVVRR
ncbi:MAG: betaine-aldehyde dehydrogenase [Mycobacterium sp.]|jgi:acyl-CoA reductase-like NAD-dependent aldehyde dehydrogenase|nr:betaine-aldehyde dehydrogenase [Mycobacterium sp.]